MTRPPAKSAQQKPDASASRERASRTPAHHAVATIAAVARNGAKRRKKKPRIFTHAHRQRLDRAAEHYLRKCYRTNSAARASEFATELGLTPEYASWLAAKIVGMSLRDYLRGKQVVHAAWLLRTLPGEMTVEEIAIRSGFGTARTLYRCFLAAYGTTPGAFRGLKK